MAQTFSGVREELSLFLNNVVTSEGLMAAKRLSFCYFVRIVDGYFELHFSPQLQTEQNLRLHPAECLRGEGLCSSLGFCPS